MRINAVILKTRNNDDLRNEKKFLPNCDFSYFESKNSYKQQDYITQENYSYLGNQEQNNVKISKEEVLTAKQFFEKKGLVNQMSGVCHNGIALVKHWVVSKIGLLCEVKNGYLKTVEMMIPGEEFRLINGSLFGEFSRESYSDDELYHSFQTIGMLHVVSASGYNIALVMVLVEKAIEKFSPSFWQSIIVLISLWLYALLTGFNASIVRASLMATIGIFVVNINRQYNSLFGLVVSAATMVVIHPIYVTEISFQLSVLASLGIILAVPRAVEHISTSKGLINTVFNVFRESFLTSGAAQLLVLPLLIYHFGELSLLSLLTNTLLLWFIPIITLSSFFLLLLVVVEEMVADFIDILFFWLPQSDLVLDIFNFFIMIFAMILEGIIRAFYISVRFFGQFEGSLIKVNTPFLWWMVILWWFGAGLLVKYSKNMKNSDDL